MKTNLLKQLSPNIDSAEGESLDLSRYIEMAEMFSSVSSASVYLLDYYHGNVPFVSDQLLPDSVRRDMQDDFSTYLYRYTDAADVQKMVELGRASRAFLARLPMEQRKKYTLFFQFKLNAVLGKRPLYVARIITPMAFTSDGQVWLSLGSLSVAPKSHNGMAALRGTAEDDVFLYSFEQHQWSRLAEQLPNAAKLSLLSLAEQGLSSAEIAEELSLSVETVKTYKKQLFRKLGVSNMPEAITAFSWLKALKIFRSK